MVIVTTCPAPVAVNAHFGAKPNSGMIVGFAGTAKPAGKVTVIVSPSRRLPDPLTVKSTVHVARAFTLNDELFTVTPLTEVAATRVTAVAATAVVSALVLTVGWTAPVVGRLTTPRISKLASLESGSAQVPPLSASVTVATVPTPVTVAEQLMKPDLKSTGAGPAGTVKLAG